MGVIYRMRVSWMDIAAFTERVRSRIVQTFHGVRTLLIWWLLGLGRRPMVFLSSGIWTEWNRKFDADQVRALYDPETHSVLASGMSGSLGSRDRWPWLAAEEVGGARRDLSSFFGSLRVARGLALTPADILALFACQEGWLPRGTLRITLRDGTEETVDAVSGQPLVAFAGGGGPSSASQGVNYIR
jgi:hypothetical protein